MTHALIGTSGFIGGTLSKVATFDDRYRSSDIASIEGRSFDCVVCAGAPAQKWIANRDPAADRANIDRLIGHMKTINCRTFILISTVDVFQHPTGVDEDSPVDETGLHPYGLHRRLLEKFVESQFARHLIVRLPGLVGPGLRKNVIFDFLNDNEIAKIDSRGVFQFYPTVNLWFDVQAALEIGLRLVHLNAEPISVSDIAHLGFGRQFHNPVSQAPARYDLITRHAEALGGRGPYLYSARETIQAVRAFAQSEPVTLGVQT